MSRINILKDKIIGFIGAGNMASAIIEGLLISRKVKSCSIYISDKDNNKKLKKKRNLKIKVAGNNRELIKASDIIIIAVKPRDINDLLEEIKNDISSEKVVISIAAGITIKHLKRYISGNNNIIRVMPNIGSLKQESMTCLSFSRNTASYVKETVVSIFSGIGKVEEISEKDMHLATALSGSGPAYIAYFLNLLIKAAKKEGLSFEKARRMTLQTARSSISLLEDKNIGLDELIRMVASKGGTTEAALKVFKDKKMDEILRDAFKAAVKRSKDLLK